MLLLPSLLLLPLLLLVALASVLWTARLVLSPPPSPRFLKVATTAAMTARPPKALARRPRRRPPRRSRRRRRAASAARDRETELEPVLFSSPFPPREAAEGQTTQGRAPVARRLDAEKIRNGISARKAGARAIGAHEASRNTLRKS